MANVDIDIEELIGKDIASKLLENIPSEMKQQLLEKSLTKTLEDVLKPWNIEQAIKTNVNEYMIDYITRPEVQEKIKIATNEAMDELINGITNAIVIGSQERIQNTYSKLVKVSKRK